MSKGPILKYRLRLIMFADSIWLLCPLFVAGMAAGLVDSITGGGGLIALPVLLATGMPPHLAMGTNMFQSSLGSLAAAYIYISKGSVQLREVRLGVGFTFLGSAAGALMVRHVDAKALSVPLPIVVFTVFVYTVLAYPVLTVDARPRVRQRLFYGLPYSDYSGKRGSRCRINLRIQRHP